MIAPTRPVLPRYDDYINEIRSIWDNGILTNNGEKVCKFKEMLQRYICYENIDLFVNGHSALVIALRSLGLRGEAITSPFTFISTTNALVQAGLTPVFCDINDSYNIDPDKIDHLITEKTSAIVVPHIFGIPCDVERIQEIADRYHLKVIYDAAQAFGTKVNGKHIVLYGDISMVSFHAIKVFNSIEGGMLIYRDPAMHETLLKYRNFGFNEQKDDVSVCGFNGKMNEFQAAMGIVNLKGIEDEINKRCHLAERYCEKLENVQGISTFSYQETTRYNYAYFPILVDEKRFGVSRDELWSILKKRGIGTRKLYDKLVTDHSYYLQHEGDANLPLARTVSEKALDLPLYGTLDEDAVDFISGTIQEISMYP